MQLIPSLDLLGGRVVRLRHGDPNQTTFYGVTPRAWLERLVAAGAKRIHLVDLEGAFGREAQPELVQLAKALSGVAFQLGGGLRTREAIARVIDAGLEPVVGTLAVEQPEQLRGLDASRIIAALDVDGEQVLTRGWQAKSAMVATELFPKLRALGLARALVTDVKRDGTLTGPGIEAARFVAGHGFAVQASGGIASLDDLATLRTVPGVVGAISGRALLDGKIDLGAPAVRAALEGR
ncbi:MAG: 1-(5-phosphoribosyl)-5-((5-phosphoribosylamino)methylideneamino)imidazole-4-carboxamide isomerase [Deltaproteobacteria bacterium]|nr:1-(5-phosphoribosyl)-5-((5-phosphoribosylamino)methylideneamino)imidazole-4-carboxamide isomerase [Deltaproteobacteria bacterium]